MARFIFVHGAWHGGWCWEEIVSRLAAGGHDICAPDLPGMGADVASGHVATLDEWAMFIAGMASGSAEPAIVVGHSRGGVVISRAAELAPDAMRHLVYLAAAMVTPGETLGTLFERPEAVSDPRLAAAVHLSDDGQTTYFDSPDLAMEIFYNSTPEVRARAAVARLTPEPVSIREAPIPLTAGRYGRIDRSYIICEQDRAVAPELQHAMVRCQPCATYRLASDHSPFFSAPDKLTEILMRIAES